MNGNADVVGVYRDCGEFDEHAFAWFGGPIILLPLPPKMVDARASDISDKGAIVITGRDACCLNQHGFLFSDGKFTSLSTLPGGTYSAPLAINNAMQVVGNSGNTIVGPAFRGFLWEDGQMRELKLPIGPKSTAYDINDDAVITGGMGNATQIDFHAYLWTKQGVTDLGVIPGGYAAEGRAISSNGFVTGFGFLPAANEARFVRHAFFWDKTKMIDIGVLPGFDESFGWAVNSAGTVVGYCMGDLIQRAFIWRDGVLRDLNDLYPLPDGHLIYMADDINDAGQILVEATGPPPNYSMILTPTFSSITDLTGDCHTDAADLQVLLKQWGATRSPAPASADYNHDGHVGPADLAQLLAHWG
jgi:probable HAF family extracellular repeat protein